MARRVKLARGVEVAVADHPTEFYVASRTSKIAGRDYLQGDRVQTEGLADIKLAQLCEQRVIHLISPLAQKALEAIRVFTVRGVTFTIGDTFSTRGLAPAKVAQLLEHRYIQPTATA